MKQGIIMTQNHEVSFSYIAIKRCLI